MVIEYGTIFNGIGALFSGMSLVQENSAKQNNMSEDKLKEKDEAINSVMHAIIHTRAYLHDSRELGKPNRKKETELSALWQESANLIRNFDNQLFRSSQVKAFGWSDPNGWDLLRSEAATVKLDDLVKQCKWLIKN